MPIRDFRSPVNIPTERYDPLAEGARIGGMVGDIGGNIDKFAFKPERDRKAQEVVDQYNDPENEWFKQRGLTGSKRTEALSSLLKQHDNKLAGRYDQLAKEEAVAEREHARKKELMDADKAAKAEEASNPQSMTNLKQIALQYRTNLRSRQSESWKNFNQAQKDELDQSLDGYRTILSKTELGRALMGQIEQEIPAVEVPEVASQAQAQAGDDTADSVKQMELKDVRDSLSKLGTDELGFLTNIESIDNHVDDLAARYGENDSFVTRARAAVERSKKAAQDRFKTGTEEQKRKTDIGFRARAEDRTIQEKVADSGALIYSMNELKDNPDSTPAKATALTSVLRKESGASIADSEFGRRMQGWLSAEDYEAMLGELTGAKIIIAGKISGDLRDAQVNRITSRYLSKVSADKIMAFTAAMLPKFVREYSDLQKQGEKDTKGAAKTKSNPLGL